MKRKLRIHLSSSITLSEKAQDWFEKLIDLCVSAAELGDIPQSIEELSIALLSNEEMRELNRNFRGKDSATDVLSFSQLEGKLGAQPRSLGDIAISLERAQNQCRDFGNDLEHELLRLIVHGLLHLLGFDHEDVSDEERMAMEAEEERIRGTVAEQISFGAFEVPSALEGS